MFYKKDKSLSVKGSASALYNNLSAHVNLPKGIITYAVVHKYYVNLVSAPTDGTSSNHKQVMCKEPTASPGTSMVLQAKLVHMGSRTLLVIASQKGIQMYEADSSVMLYWCALSDTDHAESEQSFGRGICGVDNNTVCVGSHNGRILVLDVPSKGSNITLSETLAGHRQAICELAADRRVMVSSDEGGDIVIWQPGDTFTQLSRIQGNGVPCTSLALLDDSIVAAYGSGHLRVFSSASGKLTAEITAHARWINALDVAPESALVLTGSEDGYARVWHINKGSTKVELVHSELVRDCQIQGVQFIGKAGHAFACTAYDSTEIQFYTKA